MNVVGRVGSYLSQSVYSVATPFHPFGGAVDIIVVQQQDGSFRSTPWYVRFGKFQGVLKGAEKIVRIDVNGIEANFHMYLDNAGEAYFIKEIEPSKKGETNGGVKDSKDYTNNDDGKNDNSNFRTYENSVSSSVEFQMQDERVDNIESDSERRFYEFQEVQSSLDDSIDLSEYGSNQYDNFDSVGQLGEIQDVGQLGEIQDVNSEVVLMSVDGQILTAPITSSVGNTENVQLSTPQFHLGPIDGPEFCEGDAVFNPSEATWADDYLSDLSISTAKVVSETVSITKTDADDFEHKHDDRGNDDFRVQETRNLERELSVQSNTEDASVSVKREVFKSCLELHELATREERGVREVDTIGSPKESLHAFSAAGEIDDTDVGETKIGTVLSASNSEYPSNSQVENEHNGRDSMRMIHSISDDLKLEGRIDTIERIEGSPSRDAFRTSTTEEPQASSSDDRKRDSRIRLEISLCGKLLRAGMGVTAAAEAFDSHRVSEEDFKRSASSITKNESLVVRIQGRYLTWDKAAHVVLGMAAYDLHLPVEPSDTVLVEQDNTAKLREGSGISTSSGRRWRLWPIPFRRVKTLEHTNSDSSSEEVFVDSESGLLNQPAETTPTSSGGSVSPHKQLVRSNVPTNEQIASLYLKEGQNVVSFIFSTRVLGVQKVDAHIYLWKWNAKIVISDVDGTITKSDVLGQFMPLVGRDWTQSGVARLFSAIKENGYQLLFLSARAIVQAYLTRSFLLNLKQDGKALPKGPVVISPDGLFPSLFREVIRRAPHEFKIACLEDIKALFPSDYNPFYAGFGNRDTDRLSYRKIGIPKGKIFIINPKGEVAISHVKEKSYTSLHTLVNDMFPPTSVVEQEDYNSWNYWRMPLPEVDM